MKIFSIRLPLCIVCCLSMAVALAPARAADPVAAPETPVERPVVEPAPAGAKEFEDKVERLFRTFDAVDLALSPDGQHVAFTQHANKELSVVIQKVDAPYTKRRIIVAADQHVPTSKERRRVALSYLRWSSANRLVFATQPIDTGVRQIGEVFACDADGGNIKTLCDQHDFEYETMGAPGVVEAGEGEEPPPPIRKTPRPFVVLGRVGGDTEHILIEATGSRGSETMAAVAETPTLSTTRRVAFPTTIYKVNVHTGKVTQTGTEDFAIGRYLYDRQGRLRVLHTQPLTSLERAFRLLDPSNGRWRDMVGAWANGQAGDFRLTPANFHGERSVPLAMEFDGKVLYYASNVGRDTFGVYGINIETKQRTPLAIEHPHVDLVPLTLQYPNSSSLVFDEHRQRLVGVRANGLKPVAIWTDAELADIQRSLERKFSRRTVEVVDWDEARRRFLVRVTGGTEPGRYFIYQRTENLLVEFRRRAPWLQSSDVHETIAFEFDSKDRVHLTGHLTFPRKPRRDPAPLLILFPDNYEERTDASYDRNAQVLADLGFIVARLNPRGTAGLGIRHRDTSQFDLDWAAADDAAATLEWLSSRHRFDRRRVALMGQGVGGFLAFRTLQLKPELFRCAVGIDAPLDIARWTRQDPEMLQDIDSRETVDFGQEVRRALFKRIADKPDASVLRRPELLTKPVFIVVDPQKEAEVTAQAMKLKSELKQIGRDFEYLELSEEFDLGLPAARARFYRQLEGFFNLHLYNYKTDIGETEVIP